MNDTRGQIRAHVRANAGIHFNELVRESEFAPGQIQYHVRRLIDDDDLVRREFYGRTHYYPPTYDEWERAALALFRRETAREIVVYLLESPSSDPGSISADLGIARSTLEYHLERLVGQEIVEKSYDDRNRVSLRLVAPERTATLLSVVEPTVPDRLVDRFTRLVDSVLESSPDPD
ncbi:ArsR family transcriptional regulator [Natrarchaeobius halalkaliphilus]|uniref:ArsR family transcriptional regulator n=1 Tax=Natrarchaeobius halalkaliphilus TaxID=1679091 RepID=A0A3N6M267_9EURY|nr:ArsR family transcriptional regulator [Natrarchaeobius halalkaliphilus]RQG89201.1 ArsR family transcriptional regulator [Natrarchaeobius halalkaliphilus]